MKSNVKLLIIGAAVIVILAAAVILLTVGGGEETGEPVSSETTASTEPLSRLLYDKDPSVIENIHVSNETGEYDIVKYNDSSWFVSDFIGLPHSAAALQDICGSAASFTSQQVVTENAEDMSVYGLDKPLAEVTVSFGSETKELLIGNETPSAGLSYAAFKGENTVYTVNTSDVDVFMNDRFHFLARTVYTARQPADENDTTNYTKIEKLTISRDDIDYDIVLEYDVRQDDADAIYGNSSSHIMTDPVRLDLNPDKSYDLINGVFNLTATEIAVAAPTEEIIAQYGLDDPYCTVSYEITGGDFRLNIGNEYVDENGKALGRYCMADGIDILYMFDYSIIPWVKVMPLDISMSMITSTYIYTIDTITVETAEGTNEFRLSGGQEDFKVECDDSDVTEEGFKDFYQYILRAPAEELYLDECTDPADITITISHEYGEDKLEFINSSDRKTVIRLNGRPSFKCRTSYVNRLMENVGYLLDGEKIVTTW
ncbi:MAG: DUF4340 domain-containing protein [Oscillospiraceae bacterium]|nr:DUF4340 domain-containing protein [Oscillospiraceae bacterium]